MSKNKIKKLKKSSVRHYKFLNSPIGLGKFKFGYEAVTLIAETEKYFVFILGKN